MPEEPEAIPTSPSDSPAEADAAADMATPEIHTGAFATRPKRAFDAMEFVMAREADPNVVQTRLKLGGIMMGAVLTMVGIDYYMGASFFFMLLVAVATALGMLEFYNMARQHGAQPWWFVGTLFGLLIVCGQWAAYSFDVFKDDPILRTECNSMLLFAFLVCMMIFNVLAPELKQDSQNIMVTTFGVIYIAWFMSFYVKLRYLGATGQAYNGWGNILVLLVFLGSKCTDIGAWFIGRKFGRSKLAPKVSPGKTEIGRAHV